MVVAGGIVIISLALRWHFPFDIIKVFTTVSVKVGVAEGPALQVARL